MPDSLSDAEFQRVYSNPGNVFPSPEDWRDCPIYFLMVDRFNNSAKPPLHKPFDDPGFFAYQGGSFDGVRAQLNTIKSLGAAAIWLSPVLKNRINDEGCYHGYGIHDFLHANPRFASNPANADDELRALVDAAHAAGLYVIFDIVLNHTGDMFAYDNAGSQAPFSPTPLPIAWRDETGAERVDWQVIETIQAPLPADALVWPKELQVNAYFRRQGQPGPTDDTVGDFASLKQMMTEAPAVQKALIRAYQYVIGRFDIDGFRIDTLRYLKGGLPLTFGNAIREYALAIGKKNFFTFGEVWTADSELAIANFIGRNTSNNGDLVGVDAALDYPLFDVLKPTVKGFTSPRTVIDMYAYRKTVEEDILSSHGDATRYFVTFLDNHDVKERLRHWDPSQQSSLDDEVTLGIACLASLPGIPCIYYGTEQGLHGAGSDPAVREALWGDPTAFDVSSTFYKHITQILQVRETESALRYGRFYFRQLSGDGTNFGFSSFAPGILAFSRILNDREIVVITNFSKIAAQQVYVVVDSTLTQPGTQLTTRYSNKDPSAPAAAAEWMPNAVVSQMDGSTSQGACAAFVTLAGGEVQILG